MLVFTPRLHISLPILRGGKVRLPGARLGERPALQQIFPETVCGVAQRRKGLWADVSSTHLPQEAGGGGTCAGEMRPLSRGSCGSRLVPQQGSSLGAQKGDWSPASHT